MGDNSSKERKISLLDNPCRWCKYRHQFCHSHCFMYKLWKAQRDIINERARREAEEYRVFVGLAIKRKKFRVRGDKR